VEAPAGFIATPVPLSSQIVLTVVALAVVALGCAPNLLIGKLLNAIKLAGF